MQLQSGLLFGNHSGKLPMLMSLAGADSTAERGYFREREPSIACGPELLSQTKVKLSLSCKLVYG